MKKKILITAGGTGGHIFPAIALGKQLSNSADVLFVGGNLSTNPYFEREAFPSRTVSCATFKSKNPLAVLKTLAKISLGIAQSCQILREYQPDIVVGFGSYYTLPILLASKMKKIPFILHEANSIPGKVNRLLSKYAAAVGIHFPETSTLLKGKTHEVGLPLRQGYKKNFHLTENARAYFGLDASRFTILVFGGSQGAAKLNHLSCQAFAQHLHKENIQIIHIAGEASLAQQLNAEYQKVGLKACVKSFESRMDLAWQAADLAITRSGAGTIAEAMEFEVPCILIPYPYATDNHQDKNADFFVKRVQGAIKFNESELTPLKLTEGVKFFSEENLNKMRQNINVYKIHHRSKNFCDLIVDLINVNC